MHGITHTYMCVGMWTCSLWHTRAGAPQESPPPSGGPWASPGSRCPPCSARACPRTRAPCPRQCACVRAHARACVHVSLHARVRAWGQGSKQPPPAAKAHAPQPPAPHQHACTCTHVHVRIPPLPPSHLRCCSPPTACSAAAPPPCCAKWSCLATCRAPRRHMVLNEAVVRRSQVFKRRVSAQQGAGQQGRR